MDHPHATAPTDAPTRRRYRNRTGRAVPITPAMLAGAPDFAPVPRGAVRYDGWTPERQRAFVKALAETGSVRHAAQAVGMAETGAYQLRLAPGGEGFAKAWADALSVGVARLGDVALERALNGVPVPIFHRGEQVGEKRRYNDRLLMWVLRHHDPQTYGGPIGNRVPPHIRAALRAEWEQERTEADRESAERSHDRMLETLELMRQRLQAVGKLPPDGPGNAGMSVAQRYVILSHHYAELSEEER